MTAPKVPARPDAMVSVVMPLYNSSAFMSTAIRSVLRQEYEHLELILVDDGSTDDTLQQATIFAQGDPRVRIVAQPVNGGAGAARNAGIAVANGRYVAFLDSDDFWEPSKLALQVAEMTRRDAGFSYTDFVVVSGGDSTLVVAPDRMSYHDLAKNTAIGCSTVMYDRLKFGLKQFPALRKHEDLGLWLEMLKEAPFAFKCGGALTHYIVRPGSVSSNKLKAVGYTWKVYRDLEKIPLPRALYYFAHYATAASIKRLRRRRRSGAETRLTGG